MSVNLSPILNGFQSFLNTGLPNNGGLIYTYAAGTTTPTATYTSVTGSTPNANPIVLDSYGRVPNEIWLTSGIAYKLVVTDSSSVQLGVYDNIFGVNDINATSVGSSVVSKTGLIGSALMPAGTTGQRDSIPAIGYTRFNTTTNQMEAYTGIGWYSAAPIASPTFTGTVTAPAFIGSLTGNASGTAANVTGTVAIANGGTGQTTAANATIALQTMGAGQSFNYPGKALNTVYTNSTGRTIFVCGYCTNTSLGVIQWYVNSSTAGVLAAASGAVYMPFAMMVPAGATYQVNISSGSLSLSVWSEVS